MNFRSLRAVWLIAISCLALPSFSQVVGIVTDSVAGEPVAFATVTLLNNSDSILTGAISDENGSFQIQNPGAKVFKLRVNAVGFKTQDFGPYQLGAVMGKTIRINMVPPEGLPAVEITATQDFVQNKIDRKIYTADRSLVTQGGSAADLLNTIPSVEVDIDGQLNLRGNANVTVFIDGKPSSLTGSSRAAILDQLPASAIKSIEVITHPSAKFDPDGTAGIINIITKKESRQGLNGNISVGVGTNNKYNLAASLNYRRKHFNLSGSYSGRIDDRWNEGLANTYTAGDSISPYQLQDNYGEGRSLENVGKLGLDIYVGKRSTLSLGATYSHNQRKRQEDSEFIESDPSQIIVERYMRRTDEFEPRQNIEGEINFSHKPAKEGSSLDARASLAHSAQQDSETYFTDSLSLVGLPTGIVGPIQSGESPETFILGTAQIDYVVPVPGKIRLETGAKSTLRDIQAAYTYGSYANENAPFVYDSTISNSFRYQEQVHAAYLILGRSFGKISAEAGLRAEQALTGFTLFNTDSTYQNNYFNFFPSAHLGYQQTEKSEFRLAYSRRINRPETDNLNPFAEYSNPKRLRRGNPMLQPEYIHAIELSHLWRHKIGSLSSTAYYRRLTNSVTRVIRNIGGDTLEANVANMLDGHSLGLELIAQVQPHKLLDITLSANMFRTSMDASNITPGLLLVNYGVDGRVLISSNLNKRWSLQTTYNYQPPRLGPQGRIGARHSMDAALKHTLMKGKANLTLRVSDIFNTMQFNIHTEDDGLISDFYRKRESRIGFLTFSYRFGQEEKGQKKQRKEEREGGGGGGFDF